MPLLCKRRPTLCWLPLQVLESLNLSHALPAGGLRPVLLAFKAAGWRWDSGVTSTFTLCIRHLLDHI